MPEGLRRPTEPLTAMGKPGRSRVWGREEMRAASTLVSVTGVI